LLNHQHPGHQSHLSSSNCSPEVIQVPDYEDDSDHHSGGTK
jgi:hypothetical protein